VGTAVKKEHLVTIIVVVVVTVWGISGLIDLLLEDYTALSITTPVMLLVVGAMLGIRTRPNGNHVASAKPDDKKGV